jgi:lipoprotein signal peptidase
MTERYAAAVVAFAVSLILAVLAATFLIAGALGNVADAIRTYPTPAPVVQPVQSFDLPPIIVRVYPEPGR